MRRSRVVHLTLLPMLASAAVASAQAAPEPAGELVLTAPGMTAPADAPATGFALSPPGLTPTIDELDCDDDPSWRLRPDCEGDADGAAGGVIRGGFGNYFGSGGG